MATPATERLSDGVWRLPLASRTMPPWDHTNAYLVANGSVGALVDPGSSDAASVDVLRAALDEAGVTLLKAVLLTHTHGDHRAGVPLVHETFGAPAVYVHPLEAARLDDSVPVTALSGGRTIMIGDLAVRAVHTPGHSPGHLAFHLPDEGVLLAGDLVAGRGSVWVGTPEGDVAAYLSSLRELETLDATLLGPGHGPLVRDPARHLRAALEHRLERERQVVEALGRRQRTLTELRESIYPGLSEPMSTMAERSLLAHLQKLMREMRVLHLGSDETGPFALESTRASNAAP